MKKMYAALLGVIVLAATTANAQRFPGPRAGQVRSITLNIGDAEYQRMGDIHLKQIMRSQQPYESPENMDLESVTLTAKSMQGNGQAELRINGQPSATYTIGGRPYQYNNPAEWTFDNVTIYNSQRFSQGSWQITLRGFNKVRRVTLNVRDRIVRPVPPPRPPMPIPQPPRPVPQPGPTVSITVRGLDTYYPDSLTAQGLCVSKGYSRAVGMTDWKQAGNQIAGKRSYDGSAFFSSHTWLGGRAIDTVQCQ